MGGFLMLSSFLGIRQSRTCFRVFSRNCSVMFTDRERTQEEIQSKLDRYSRFAQTRIWLTDLLGVGAKDQLKSYKFLRGEIPTRLSHAILELESIPGPLLEQPSIREICQKYRTSFLDLLPLPLPREVTESSKEAVFKEFAIRLEAILLRHQNVVSTMGMGILELKQSQQNQDEEMFSRLKEFLDRFYMSRIGLRTHMEQYLSVYASPHSNVDENQMGIFSLDCNIKEIIEHAACHTSDLCKSNFCDAPSVEIHVFSDATTKIVYCPSHLHYIITELLKNSMRAVVEFHGEDKLEYPPIIVNVYMHNQELVIKISDKGGGIPQEDRPKLFSYSYSTAQRPDLVSLRMDDCHFAGFGYGLALSRLHARYLGGELTICPVYGYGTDVFIHIRNSKDAREVLPTLDRARLERYNSGQSMTNWMEDMF